MDKSPPIPDNRYIYERDGLKFIQINPLFPKEILDRIWSEFQLFQGDVVITAFPKCGTTWMSEIVYLLQHGCEPTEDSVKPISSRVPLLEIGMPPHHPAVAALAERQPPRLMNTHLWPQFYQRTLGKQVDEGAKFVVMFRNPKDVLVSYFHFHFLAIHFNGQGTWDDFFDLYKANLLPYGDVVQWMADWWRHRDHPSVLIIKYEELHVRHAATVRRVAHFLDINDVSDDVINNVVELTKFKVMSKNPSSNWEKHPLMVGKGHFMRKGETGDWRNYFSQEQAAYMDDVMEKKLVSLGITFEV